MIWFIVVFIYFYILKWLRKWQFYWFDSTFHFQAFYRGRQEAIRIRVEFRKEFDLAIINNTTDSIYKATKLLALFFVNDNSNDVKRLAAWCRAILGFKSITGELQLSFIQLCRNFGIYSRYWLLSFLICSIDSERTTLLFYYYNTSDSIPWNVLVRQISLLLLTQSSLHPG